MRRVRTLTLALLIAIALVGCSVPGTAAPTLAPIIIIASPTIDPAQPSTAAATPAGQPQPTAAVAAPAPIPTIAATAESLPTALLTAATANALNAPQIRLSQATLIAIFRGEITSWADSRIQDDNPSVTLPNLPIRVVYRSDSSGTTRAITEYFVQVDRWWADNIGAAYRLGDAGSKPWPTGEGTNGSGQLVNYVKATPGAIGYVAPSYAQSENLPLAILNNAAGNWVSPASSTLNEAAANTVNNLDRKLRGFIVNAPGQNAYPLALYTWIMACPAGLKLEQAQALTDFLYWSITDPQAIAAARQLGYEPLPSAIRQKALAQLEAIQIGNQRVFTAPTADQAFTPRQFATQVSISGSGATFPNPLYQDLIKRYQQVEPSVALSYNAEGSTQGRADLLQSGIVQFAGSEEAVADDDLQITRPVCQPTPLHNPMIVGAVGIVYNLPPGS
jgi:phosphate ABC transporter phosphate-binding protein